MTGATKSDVEAMAVLLARTLDKLNGQEKLMSVKFRFKLPEHMNVSSLSQSQELILKEIVVSGKITAD